MIQKKSIITRARRATAFFVVAFPVVAFSMMAFPAMAAEQITPDQIVTYKEVSGVELKLHVFKPGGHQASDKRPAIVFFFGGGWSGGNPKQFYQQSRFLKKCRHQVQVFSR